MKLMIKNEITLLIFWSFKELTIYYYLSSLLPFVLSFFSIKVEKNEKFDPLFTFDSIETIKFKELYSKISTTFNNYIKEPEIQKGILHFMNKLLENSNEEKYIFLPDD